jgi:hypothetical protein
MRTFLIYFQAEFERNLLRKTFLVQEAIPAPQQNRHPPYLEPYFAPYKYLTLQIGHPFPIPRVPPVHAEH